MKAWISHYVTIYLFFVYGQHIRLITTRCVGEIMKNWPWRQYL